MSVPRRTRRLETDADDVRRLIAHLTEEPAFAAGWRVDAIERTTLDSPVRPEGIHAWSVALTREDGPC